MQDDQTRARSIASIGRHHAQIEAVTGFDRNRRFRHEWRGLNGERPSIRQDDGRAGRGGEKNAFRHFLRQSALGRNVQWGRPNPKLGREGVRERGICGRQLLEIGGSRSGESN